MTQHHATRLAPRTGALPPEPTLADICAPLSAKVMPSSVKSLYGSWEASEGRQLGEQRRKGGRRKSLKTKGVKQ